ncbi:MAG: DUF1501 domain-containing protein [Pirellulales bacterium]
MSPTLFTRRYFLEECRLGLGSIALWSLLQNGQSACSQELAVDSSRYPQALPGLPHHPAKVRRVIFLFMAGAPSQLDLFDYKPELVRWEGKPIPPSVIEGQRYAFIQPNAAVLAPRFPFAKQGKCGMEISDQLPHLGKIVDRISLIRSVSTDQFNHAPAQLTMNTGNGIPGRPSMGSWISYGLGSEASDLPSFVVLKSGDSLSGGAAMWSAGFLPSKYQGVPFRGQGDPILHTTNPKGMDTQMQRDTLDVIRSLNDRQWQRLRDPEIQTRTEAYEMAFRMQMRSPELMDYSSETKETMELYGAEPGAANKAFANNCLLARRLAERGVRFIQVYHAGWDHHSDVAGGLKSQCKQTDQACAALIQDLERRGMLDDTLVVWGGEFGRTPMVEASAALGRSQGRDHHPQAFSMWLCGGGIKQGFEYGKTDELGFHPIEGKVDVRDIQATILHLLGIDHARLTFEYQGLRFRLTGVEDHSPIGAVLA